MNWCDERLGFVQAPSGPIEGPEAGEIEARLAALPMDDLVRGFRESNITGLKDQTPGTRAFHMYFDRIAYDTPERAVDFIEAMLAEEPDDAMVALLAEGKLLGQLLHFHGPRVARSLQELALRRPRLRWLLGGVAWSIGGGMVDHDDAKRRLRSIADRDAYDAWEESYRAGSKTIDFAALSTADLAPLWVEITSRSDLDREKDEHWNVLFDFQSELVNTDPLKALDLVKAILEIEDNPHVLGLLAAGMLEDLIPGQDGPVVDAVVAEAERNPRFRYLLGGVWFSSLSPEVTARLEQARGEIRW